MSGMTDQKPTDMQLAARQAAERTAQEQGLPSQITDPEVLDDIAALARQDDDQVGEAA